jgi:hypothetical protein
MNFFIKDKKLVLRSLANTLLRPWTGVLDQQWPQRQSVYMSLIGAITADLQNFSEFNIVRSRGEFAPIFYALKLTKTNYFSCRAGKLFTTFDRPSGQS